MEGRLSTEFRIFKHTCCVQKFFFEDPFSQEKVCRLVILLHLTKLCFSRLFKGFLVRVLVRTTAKIVENYPCRLSERYCFYVVPKNYIYLKIYELRRKGD